MTTEPSDIVKLLNMLAQEHGDATCHRLAQYAHQGANILEVCHEAIRVLATEKIEMRKRLFDEISLRTLPPIVISKEDAAKIWPDRP